MSEPIPPEAHDLLDEPNLAFVATLLPDGSPQLTPVWVERDGDTVVFNTARGRSKPRNLERDARVAVAIADRGNPYRYLQVRGRAALSEDGADAHIHKLSHKYTGEDYPLTPDERRLIVRVEPESVSFRP